VLQQRLQEYWNNVPAVNERNQINVPYIPITVIGCKYDEFSSKFEPKLKKLFC